MKEIIKNRPPPEAGFSFVCAMQCSTLNVYLSLAMIVILVENPLPPPTLVRSRLRDDIWFCGSAAKGEEDIRNSGHPL